MGGKWKSTSPGCVSSNEVQKCNALPLGLIFVAMNGTSTAQPDRLDLAVDEVAAPLGAAENDAALAVGQPHRAGPCNRHVIHHVLDIPLLNSMKS